ncbi:hypothetical protein VaNZ11_007559 [Volvox africanus]|uniref:Zinc finger PHD-type domain-containing protein n=1 Tax=Volvox africanus TaxID=51714 RepID=A0ABQ5S4Y2_9CHLO|nr:hypothetical protein VaNZ11_007559 [Volvox africanus]
MSEIGSVELFNTETGTYQDGYLKRGIRRVLDLQFKGNQPGFDLTCCECKIREISNDEDPAFLIALVHGDASSPFPVVRLWDNSGFLCTCCRSAANCPVDGAGPAIHGTDAAAEVAAAPSMSNAAIDGAPSLTPAHDRPAHVTTMPAATTLKSTKPPSGLGLHRASAPGAVPSAAADLQSRPATVASWGDPGDGAAAVLVERSVAIGQTPAPAVSPPRHGLEPGQIDPSAGGGGADGVVHAAEGVSPSAATKAPEAATMPTTGEGNSAVIAPNAQPKGGMVLREYCEVNCGPVMGKMLNGATVGATYARNYLLVLPPDSAVGSPTAFVAAIESLSLADRPAAAATASPPPELLTSTADAARAASQHADRLSPAELQLLRDLDFSVPSAARRTLSHTLLAIADWVLSPESMKFADAEAAATAAAAWGPGSISAAVGTRPSLALAAQLRPWAFVVRRNDEVVQYGTCLRPSLQCLGGRAVGNPPTSVLEVVNAPPFGFSLAREVFGRKFRSLASLKGAVAAMEGPKGASGFKLRPGWVLPLHRLAALLKTRNKRADSGPWRMSPSQLDARLEELLQDDALYQLCDPESPKKQWQQQHKTLAGKGHDANHGDTTREPAAGLRAATQRPNVDAFLRDLGATRSHVLEALLLSDVDSNVGFCVECGFLGALVACDSCVDSFCTKCLGVDADDLDDVWRCKYCSWVFPTDGLAAGGANHGGPIPWHADVNMYPTVKPEPISSGSRSDIADTIGTRTGADSQDDKASVELVEAEVGMEATTEKGAQHAAAAKRRTSQRVAGKDAKNGSAAEKRQKRPRSVVEEQGHLPRGTASKAQRPKASRLRVAKRLVEDEPKAMNADVEKGLEEADIMDTDGGGAGSERQKQGGRNPSAQFGSGRKRMRASIPGGSSDSTDWLPLHVGSRRSYGKRTLVFPDDELDEGRGAGGPRVGCQGADDPPVKLAKSENDVLNAAAKALRPRQRGRAARQEAVDERGGVGVTSADLAPPGPAQPVDNGDDDDDASGELRCDPSAAGIAAAEPLDAEMVEAGAERPKGRHAGTMELAIQGDLEMGQDRGEGEDRAGEDTREAAEMDGTTATAPQQRTTRHGRVKGRKRHDSDYEPSSEQQDNDGTESEGQDDVDHKDEDGNTTMDSGTDAGKEEEAEERRNRAKPGRLAAGKGGRVRRWDLRRVFSPAAADAKANNSSGASETSGESLTDVGAGEGSGGASSADSDVQLMGEIAAPSNTRGRGGRGRGGRGRTAGRGRGRQTGRGHRASKAWRGVGRSSSSFSDEEDEVEETTTSSYDEEVGAKAGRSKAAGAATEVHRYDGAALSRGKGRRGRPPRMFISATRPLAFASGGSRPTGSCPMDDTDAAAALMMLNTNSAKGAGTNNRWRYAQAMPLQEEESQRRTRVQGTRGPDASAGAPYVAGEPPPHGPAATGTQAAATDALHSHGLPSPPPPQPAPSPSGIAPKPVPVAGTALPSTSATGGAAAAAMVGGLHPSGAAADKVLQSPVRTSVVGARTAAAAWQGHQQPSQQQRQQEDQQPGPVPLPKQKGQQQPLQQQPQQQMQHAAAVPSSAPASVSGPPPTGSTGVQAADNGGGGGGGSGGVAAGVAATIGPQPGSVGEMVQSIGLFGEQLPLTKKEAMTAGCRVFEYAAGRGIDVNLLSQWTGTLARVSEWYETDMQLQGMFKACLNGLSLCATPTVGLADLERMVRSIIRMLEDSISGAAGAAAAAGTGSPGSAS